MKNILLGVAALPIMALTPPATANAATLTFDPDIAGGYVAVALIVLGLLALRRRMR